MTTGNNGPAAPEPAVKPVEPEVLFVPIPLDKAATIVSTKGMFYAEAAVAERLILKDWNPREINGVPFAFVDPLGDKRKNVILLHADNGTLPPTMPKSVMLPCNTPAKAIHLLSGVSGWGATSGAKDGTVSMIVRFHYDDGNTEDRELKNGVHFADYIRRVDVSGSTHALEMQGKQQMRYLSVSPARKNSITSIELVKGSNRTAPIVMAVTIETP